MCQLKAVVEGDSVGLRVYIVIGFDVLLDVEYIALSIL